MGHLFGAFTEMSNVRELRAPVFLVFGGDFCCSTPTKKQNANTYVHIRCVLYVVRARVRAYLCFTALFPVAGADGAIVSRRHPFLAKTTSREIGNK